MTETGYAVYIQERESINEKWDEASDPEPYNFYATKKEAMEAKKELDVNKSPLVRNFIVRERVEW